MIFPYDCKGGATPSALQPQYESPGLDLFPILKINMRGVCFSTLENLSASVPDASDSLTVPETLTGIMDLSKRWDAVIRQKGDYTEKL
jgi:hypothetical protein